MRLVGVRTSGTTYVAAQLSSETVVPIRELDAFWADPYAALESCDGCPGERLQAWDVDFVPPVPREARVLCVGLNYAGHIDEGPYEAPEYPTIFGRWTASLAVSGTPVAVPVDEPGLDWEAELVAVVGRPIWMAEPAEAQESVLAYAAFNDITARRAQKLTTQWTLGKNVDGSGPLSPFVTADEAGDPRRGLRIRTAVNADVTQDARTDQMIFGVGEVLAFISRTLELRPGDLVATGTPDGVGYARIPPRLLVPGDVVTVEIESIGAVTTPVVAPRGNGSGQTRSLSLQPISSNHDRPGPR